MRWTLMLIAMVMSSSSDPPNAPWLLGGEVLRSSEKDAPQQWSTNLQRFSEDFLPNGELTTRGGARMPTATQKHCLVQEW